MYQPFITSFRKPDFSNRSLCVRDRFFDHELCFGAVRILGLCVEHALGFRILQKLGCDLRPNSPPGIWRIRRLILTLYGLFFQHHFRGEFDRRHVAKTRPARTDFGGALKGAQ